MSQQAVEVRHAIYALARRGYLPTHIEKELQVDRRVVLRWYFRWKKGLPATDAHRSGRPTKVTSRLRKVILSRIQKKNTASLRKLQRHLTANGTSISHKTISNVLHSASLQSYRVTPKPGQKHGDKAKRLRFAKLGRQINWRSVIFSDEKRFELHSLPNKKNSVVWAACRDEVDPTPRVRHAPHCNVYAAFAYYGPVCIHIFEENLNAELYVSILRGHLLPGASRVMGTRKWRYLHDNDPKHRSKLAQEYLTDHKVQDFTPDKWPPRSPDLNPIENAWAEIAAQVRSSDPSTVGTLKRAIKEGWEKVMSIEYCQSLADSMYRRFTLLDQARGKPIKY